VTASLTPLGRLAQRRGIADAYLDYRGQPRQVSPASQAAILATLGVDTSDPQAVAHALHQYEIMRWTLVVPPAIVTDDGNSPCVPVSIPVDLDAQTIEWSLSREGQAPTVGPPESGRTRIAALETLEEGVADGRSYRRVALMLPACAPGYHHLQLTLDTGLSAELDIIVAPPRSFDPADPDPNDGASPRRALWGVAVQLYSLRSPDNWGIGDLHDLQDLMRITAALGCDIIGLNALHALMPANPAHISPYSPSNRQFLNVLYVAVPDVPDFGECEAAQQRVGQKDFQAALRELRAVPNVDYVRVAALKFEILRLLYANFRKQHLDRDSKRAASFRHFVESRGEPLRLHALYDALDADLRLQGPQYWGWPSWPAEYQDPASPAVHRYAQEHAHDVEYFMYLQWLAAGQLQGAQDLARELGMGIGLYGDVAVGANIAGSELWSNRRLYLQNASVGAPPDALALKGQNWGVPPQDPEELLHQRYRPFIDLIRSNMRYVAALRLDHVMTLYRLWWVPSGLPSSEGSYVHYPLQDLIAILALESQRNQCLVIGEDLGTVPTQVTAAMARYGVFHYKVLLFEQTSQGEFRPPSQYTPQALATVTTHDLPTLRGWWEQHDLRLRDRLDLYPSQDIKLHAHEIRVRELRALMRALVAAGLWHWQEDQPLPPYSAALCRAVHALLGLSKSVIAMIQIEDLIGMADPVNVPGTDTEHANWQRKVLLDTHTIFAQEEVRDILSAVRIARSGGHPNDPRFHGQ